jgi:perosamine synthetase
MKPSPIEVLSPFEVTKQAIENNLFCGQPSAGLRHILGLLQKRQDIREWFWNAETCYLHKARVGIRYAFDLLGLQPADEVLVPAYHCGTEIDPLLKAGAKAVLYKVDRNCRIDMEDIRNRISEKTKALYVTHYFGFPQEISAVKKICEQNRLYLIEDCAMALFSRAGDLNMGASGDVAIFSLPKTLPVPDGGVLVINNPELAQLARQLNPPSRATIARRMLPFLKSNLLYSLSGHSITKLLYGTIYSALNFHRIRAAEMEILHCSVETFDSDLYYDEKLNDLKLSTITKRMLKVFEFEKIKAMRRDNYNRLAAKLIGEQNIHVLFSELPAGVCPLNYPILIENRDIVRLELYKRGIDADAFGKYYHKDYPLREYQDARYLKEHLLSLPIHQDLNDEHIDYIAECVIALTGSN